MLTRLICVILLLVVEFGEDLCKQGINIQKLGKLYVKYYLFPSQEHSHFVLCSILLFILFRFLKLIHDRFQYTSTFIKL